MPHEILMGTGIWPRWHSWILVVWFGCWLSDGEGLEERLLGFEARLVMTRNDNSVW